MRANTDVLTCSLRVSVESLIMKPGRSRGDNCRCKSTVVVLIARVLLELEFSQQQIICPLVDRTSHLESHAGN